MNTKDLLSITVLFLVIIAVCTLLPILFIWPLNTLFSIDIEYNIKTFFAAFILLMLLNPQVNVKSG